VNSICIWTDLCVLDLSRATDMLNVNLSGSKSEVRKVQLVKKTPKQFWFVVCFFFLNSGYLFKWKFPIENSGLKKNHQHK